MDTSGSPVVNIEVYCEQGLLEPLIVTRTNETGEFSFTNLKEGPTGIFTCSSLSAWSGLHLNLPPEEKVTKVIIHLLPPGKVTGRVWAIASDGKEIPIAEAEVTRIAILGEQKVSIPLSKLVRYGNEKVMSNKDGYFVLDRTPIDVPVSLKIEHKEYAITTVDKVNVNSEVKVVLNKGCLVFGSVFFSSGSKNLAVAGAEVTFKNAQPPYESVITRTNPDGSFAVRVNPGTYLCRAETSEYMSMGWETYTISRSVGETVNLRVFPYVFIVGAVFDAISGQPISGAKISVEQGGRKSMSLTTGSSGKFRGKVTQGQAVVVFEPIPGYNTPQPDRITVAVKGDKDIELPGVWVTKLNQLRIQPMVEGKNIRDKTWIVSVSNPRQLGWYIGTGDLPIEIGITSLESETSIIGMVRLVDEDRIGTFNVKKDGLSHLQKVVLQLPGVIKGKVTDEMGNPVAGMVYAFCFYDLNTRKDYPLYQSVTDQNGELLWNFAPAQWNLLCKIFSDSNEIVWQSDVFTVAPGQDFDIGVINLKQVNPHDSIRGKNFNWDNLQPICLRGNTYSELKKKPSLVISITDSDIQYINEVLFNVKRVWGDAIHYVIVSGDKLPCEGHDLIVLQGGMKTSADTLLIDSNGIVVEETFGLPVLKKPN